MKKIYFICFLTLALDYVANAQSVNINNVSGNPGSTNIPPLSISKSVTPSVLGTNSTFSDYYDRSTSFMIPSFPINSTHDFYYFSSVGSEALIGVDYDNSANVNIDEFLVLFAAKISITGTKVFDAYIYNADANGLPTGSPLGSTTYSFASVNAPVNANAPKITTLNSTWNFTSIAFASPVAVSGNFVSVIEIDDTNRAGGYQGDCVYLYTNNCNGDGNAEDRICHYPVRGAKEVSGAAVPMQWYAASSYWPMISSLFSGPFDCDAMIIPIVQGETHTLSTNTIMGKSKGLTFLGHYPSPAKESLTINYELETKSNLVNLKIFDITGKTIFETNELDVTSGKHSFDINVSNFAAGNLYYTLKTDSGKISSRFTVVK
jgi:hypothetical protein